MNLYMPLVALHVLCVIVWLGTATTHTLLAFYGQRWRDSVLIERLPVLARWFGPRVVGPSSMGTLLSGVLLGFMGHYGFGSLWLVLALSAFGAATLVSLGVRLPATLWRNRASTAGHSAEVAQADRLLLAGAWLELAILYLAVLAMVFKPVSGDPAWLIAGAVGLLSLVLCVLIPALPGGARLSRRAR